MVGLERVWSYFLRSAVIEKLILHIMDKQVHEKGISNGYKPLSFARIRSWFIGIKLVIFGLILLTLLLIGGYAGFKIKGYFIPDVTSRISLIAANNDLESKLSSTQQELQDKHIAEEKLIKEKDEALKGLTGAIHDREEEIATQKKIADDARTAQAAAESESLRARKALEENLTVSAEAVSETEQAIASIPLVPDNRLIPASADASNKTVVISPQTVASVPPSTLVKTLSEAQEDAIDERNKQMREILDTSENWKPNNHFDIADAQVLVDRLMDKFAQSEGWNFPLIENDYGLPSVIKGPTEPGFLAEKGLKWELRSVTLENPQGKGHYTTTGWAVKGSLKKKNTIKVHIPPVEKPMKFVPKDQR